MAQIRTAAQLTRLVRAIVTAAGAPATHAEIVATSVVDADLTGHESHGVLRIPSLVEAIGKGSLKPAATPFVVHESPSTAVVDGAATFGHVGARVATDLAIQKAGSAGLAGVSLTRVTHAGRIGEWAELGAGHGLITMVAASRAHSTGTLAPYGGRVGAIGTTPTAWAIPRLEGRPPILLDFATSAVAQGKLQLARATGQSVPPGWILDAEGRPTTDVEEFFRGGALLPFGGHKGYALSVITAMLAVGLSGGDLLDPSEHGSCLFIMCVDPEAFRPADQFGRAIEEIAARLKAVPPAEGFDEVLLPGEPEARSRARRSQEGIPVTDATWEALEATARRLGVPVE